MSFCRILLPLVLISLGLSRGAGAQERFSLEDLLRLGREVNPTLQALRASVAAQDADRKASGRWENPEFEYEWGTGEPGSGEPDVSLSGFSASQVLENPLTRHFRMGALRLGVEAAGEDVRAGVLDVEYEIRLHFHRILYLEEMVKLAHLNEEALSGIRDLIETRAELGEVRELEAIRLRVEHMRAQNTTESARMELDQNRRHLNTELGNELPKDFMLEGALAVTGDDPDISHLISEVIPNHPTLQAAIREREAAGQDLRASQFGWLPNPVISGSTRQEMDGDVTTFGVGFRIPLWNQSRADSERDRQRMRMIEHQEEAIRLELEAQLIIHHNRLRLARRTLELFEEGLLEEAETSMDISEISYRQGEISFMEYLDARRTYHSIQIQSQQALFDWHVERAATVRAAGGETL